MASPVEAEDEFVEVAVDVLPPKPVIGTQTAALRQGKNPMDPGAMEYELGAYRRHVGRANFFIYKA